ncbi:MAG: insulinase family protein [Planctomycetes bacterium]|nr:insulinase family protein [Planctomycetota bacterium]
MNTRILVERFDNGLILIAEPMGWLESAAFSLVAPGGYACDPVDRPGLANFTCEMVQRGCGPRNSRQLVDDLERLGVDWSASVSHAHANFGAAMLADHIEPALAIFADLVRRPRFPAEQLEDARQVCLQEVRAVEDDLYTRVIQELRRRQYPDPYGRSRQGSKESVAAVTLEDVQNFFTQNYHPDGAILSVAGKINWDALVRSVERLFGDWSPRPAAAWRETPPQRGYEHLAHASSQTHIGIACESVPYSHPDYFRARAAVGVLSDGMSSRFFTEVRENRGLSYAVWATNASTQRYGAVLCYAGTGADRAQQTLDVMLAELTNLKAGILPEELNRVKVRIKSGLVMQQESSPARAASNAGEWYYLGRVQTLEEVENIIDALTVEEINAWLAENPPRDFTIVTLGSAPLTPPATAE